MNEEVYAVAAYIARYWFAGLAVLIVWRSVKWMRKDNERVSRVQSKLPDAGFIGEWAVVASDARSIPEGYVMRAPRDGWIGSARACDVRLKDAGVPSKAARFFLRDDGLHLQPTRSNSILVDGEEVRREAVLRHGATLTVGGVTIQLRLFAGVLLVGEQPVARPSRRRRAEREEREADGETYGYDEEEISEDDEDDPTPMIRPALTVSKRPVRRKR